MPVPMTKRAPPPPSPASARAAERRRGRAAARRFLPRRERAPGRRPPARWVVAAAALAVLFGAFFLARWMHSRGPAWLRTASPGLPDPPDAREQALLARLAAARADDPAPARLLGEYYGDAGRPFAALWADTLALQARPADVPATCGLARALEGAGFDDAAIARLRPVLAREPGQPEAVALLAELYLQTGQPERALRVVRGAGAAFVARKDGAVLEGRVLQALGDPSGARAAYWRAVAQDASDAEVRHRIGLLALGQGESFAAQQALGAAQVLAPDNLRFQVDLGRAFAASPVPKERQRALEFYAAALNRDPRFGPACAAAGEWYLRQSRWQAAIERLRIAVTADPSDAGAHDDLARALEATGQHAEAHRQHGLADQARGLRVAALREYQAWAALAQDDPAAEIQVAQSDFDLNRTQEAEARLEQARRRFPRDAAVRARLIAFYLLGLDQAQARRLCQAWLREEPGSPEVLWLLGRAAEAGQQYSETIRRYEQALAREPDNPQWLGTLGGALLTAGALEAGTAGSRERTQRAVAALARAAAGDPDEPRWRLFLAEGLQRLGRTAAARRQALRALDLDPRQSRAYTVAVQCTRPQGEAVSGAAAGPVSLFAGLLRTVEAQRREAQPLWQATWDAPRDPGAYAALAAFLIRTGDLTAAESQLAEALRLRPHWPEVRARLAMLRRLHEVL